MAVWPFSSVPPPGARVAKPVWVNAPLSSFTVTVAVLNVADGSSLTAVTVTAMVAGVAPAVPSVALTVIEALPLKLRAGANDSVARAVLTTLSVPVTVTVAVPLPDTPPPVAVRVPLVAARVTVRVSPALGSVTLTVFAPVKANVVSSLVVAVAGAVSAGAVLPTPTAALDTTISSMPTHSSLPTALAVMMRI